jgi:hypothetical protein
MVRAKVWMRMSNPLSVASSGPQPACSPPKLLSWRGMSFVSLQAHQLRSDAGARSRCYQG